MPAKCLRLKSVFPLVTVGATAWIWLACDTVGEPDEASLLAEGERIFFDETFGGNGRTCGTCHLGPNLDLTPADIANLPEDDPLFKGTLDLDTNFIARGLIRYPIRGGLLDPEFTVLRAIAPIFNVTETGPFTSDGRATRLQDQAFEAVLLHLFDGAADKPGERLPTPEELEALKAFQESIQRPGTDVGLTGAAARGKALFFGKASCGTCHVGRFLTDNDFHNTGVVNDTLGDFDIRDLPPDPGRCHVDPRANDCELSGASFNTRQLRGLSNTAPFFHNNSRATLRRVVEFYNSSIFTSSPANRRLGIGPLNLTEAEIDALVAFLERL